MSLEVLILESVGSCIDKTGETFPLNVDGTPDTNNPVHFSECEEEWYDGMSESDYSEFLEWHERWSLSIYKEIK